MKVVLGTRWWWWEVKGRGDGVKDSLLKDQSVDSQRGWTYVFIVTV